MIIKSGDKSSLVEQWQRFLSDQNFLNDNADGKFGPITLAATKKFQSFFGLEVDGTAGPNTLKKAIELGFNPDVQSTQGFIIFPRDNPEVKQFIAFRANSPSHEQFCNPGIVKDLINIGKMWFESPKNNRKSKFVIGDISVKDGGPFPPHAGHRNGKKVDVYTSSDETDISSDDYSFEKAVELARICFLNNVNRIFFNDNPQKISSLTGGTVLHVDGHDNHFHLEF